MRATCSACHLFPPPDILPRSWWRIVVKDMHLGKYLQPQAFSMGVSADEVIGWYESRAPEKLQIAHTLTRRQPVRCASANTWSIWDRRAAPPSPRCNDSTPVSFPMPNWYSPLQTWQTAAFTSSFRRGVRTESALPNIQRASRAGTWMEMGSWTS